VGREPKWVWITRTQKGAERTAQKLIQRGGRPLIAPVLDVKTRNREIEIQAGDALIVTSENALHILSDARISRTIKVYCVGAQTAKTVMDLGFKAVISAKGTVRDLCDIIQDEGRSKRFVYLRGEVVSAPLKSWLVEAGFDVNEYIVYAADSVTPDISVAQWEQIGAIMLHSARAAEVVAKLCETHLPAPSVGKIKLIAISEAVANRFVRVLSDGHGAHNRDLVSQFEICVSATADDAGMIAFIDK